MGEWDLILVKEEPFNSHKDNNVFFSSLNQRYDIIIYVLIVLNGDVAHGPLVSKIKFHRTPLSPFSLGND